MKGKRILCATAAVILTLESGCMAGPPLKSGDHDPVTQSAWVAEWDMSDGLYEYYKTHKDWQYLSWFAVSFDKDGNLHLPDSLKAGMRAAQHDGDFLTFVNDRAGSGKNGKAVEKDIETLKKLLDTPEKRKQHAEAICETADQAGVTGIELDYERVAKDKDLLKSFVAFTGELQEAAQAHGKKLRIVLEPSFPMDSPLASGPEYVVMFYNLYGTHSGPGPKADRAFIEKTLKRMEKLPGEKTAAFSNGGCVWKDAGLLGLKKGKARFIKADEAAHLRDKYKAKEERDDDSAALHFRYEENGSNYDVWYADRETLDAWITLAARHGVKSVSIWRLGNNTK